MSGHPPPDIEPKGTVQEAKDQFLNFCPWPHEFPVDHKDYAAYEAGVLLRWLKERYANFRPYNTEQDGDLANAKEMQRLWVRQVVKHHARGQTRWGVGGAERAEVFVRTDAEGRKGVSYEWQYDPPRQYITVDNRPPAPPTSSKWMCQKNSSTGPTGAVETYIFDLELTRKIEKLEGQHVHIPVSRAGAA